MLKKTIIALVTIVVGGAVATRILDRRATSED